MSAAMACWARIAEAAPTYRGLAASFAEAVMSRSAPGLVTPSAHPDLADLLQAAARLHANRPAP